MERATTPIWGITDSFFVETRVNPDTVIWQRLETAYWHDLLKALVEEHFQETQSRFTEQLLANWTDELGRFWQVAPKEMLDKLEHPISTATTAQRA